MIDELDQRLMELLIKDARQSSNLLAKKLFVDPSTIRRRVNRLVNEGYICITALPSLHKSGFPAKAIVGMDIDSHELDYAIEVISEIPELKFVSVTSGRFNVMMILWCHSTKEISQITQKLLSKLKGVKNSETFVCMNIIRSINPLDSLPFIPAITSISEKRLVS